MPAQLLRGRIAGQYAHVRLSSTSAHDSCTEARSAPGATAFPSRVANPTRLEVTLRPDVRRWFVRQTTTTQEWPVDRLLRHKGVTRVSLVLPALDEAATVGTIVDCVRRELVERVPLVDELLVLDSGSTDATARVAADAGAIVVARDDVLPHLGSVPGKGEVLWKSLHVTSGDIVAFVDADLHDFRADVVSGLLGPLLCDPGIDFVKGAAERPLQGVSPTGGGRVTELVARPLLNRHWPELAGFVQPLCGEYAARRTVLEQVPFVSGYGVEIGLLIDLLELIGLERMAQVDIGRRVHGHQDDAALGRMAGEVLSTAMARLGVESVSTSLTQFQRNGGSYRTTTSPVGVTERPPMATVAAYLAARAVAV